MIVGALGNITKNLKNYIYKLAVFISTGLLQKTTLIGIVRILRQA